MTQGHLSGTGSEPGASQPTTNTYARAMHPGYSRYREAHQLHQERTSLLQHYERSYQELQNKVEVVLWIKVSNLSRNI